MSIIEQENKGQKSNYPECQDSPHFSERPYIRKIEDIYHTPENISIWLVDGTWIRKYIQREFSNFAHHYSRPKGIGGDAFKQIPEHEFWIDQGANPEEIPYFIDHLLVEHYLMTERGLSYQVAEKEGIKIEQRERNRTTFKGDRTSLEINPEIKLLNSLSDVEIYLANGEIIRTPKSKGGVGDTRFCSGGHSEVYGYIPDKPLPRIWIDNTSVPHEWPYYKVHELHEFRDMRIGKDYPAAHKTASRIEWRCRWDDQELIRQQKQLGLE